MSPSNCQIIENIPDHAALVAASLVFKQCWQQSYDGIFNRQRLAQLDPAIWQRSLISAGRHNLLALADDRVIGVASYGHSRDSDFPGLGELMSIYVLPTEQGRGAGTYLLQRAEAGLIKLGFISSYLWVLAENQQARSFYQINDWQDVGIKQRREILGQKVDLLQYRWSAK